MAFINFFTYFSTNDLTKRIHPPFINSYASLVEDPSDSIYDEGILNTGQAGGNYPKINMLTTSRVNRIYFTIKVFNYLYEVFKNVCLEEAESPKAKSLLNFILRYYINARTSTQTHVIHSAGPVWYKGVIPTKTVYFNLNESHIIDATVFIANIINSAFDHSDEHHFTSTSTASPDGRMPTYNIMSPNRTRPANITLHQFKSHLNSLAAASSTINDALNFSVKDIFYNLSQCLWTRFSGHWPELQFVWSLLWWYFHIIGFVTHQKTDYWSHFFFPLLAL